MARLTTARTTELVMTADPIFLYRTVEYQGRGQWAVRIGGQVVVKENALDALNVIREEIKNTSHNGLPVIVTVTWDNIPSDHKPPETGAHLP